jgi:hypothetical protein
MLTKSDRITRTSPQQHANDSIHLLLLRSSLRDTSAELSRALLGRRLCWTCRWIRLALASLLSRAWNTSFAFT